MTKGIDAKDSDRTLCPIDVNSLAIEATKLFACSTFNKLGYFNCKFCRKSLPWITIFGKFFRENGKTKWDSAQNYEYFWYNLMHT